MTTRSKIFEENYQDYCKKIAAVDLPAVKDRLAIQVDNDTATVVFFDQPYQVSGRGIFDADPKKADCKVLFQKQGEYYLDPESLAMTSGLLAKKLIQADETRGE